MRLTTISQIAEKDDREEQSTLSSKYTQHRRVGLFRQFDNLPKADNRDRNVHSQRKQEVATDESIIASDNARVCVVATSERLAIVK